MRCAILFASLCAIVFVCDARSLRTNGRVQQAIDKLKLKLRGELNNGPPPRPADDGRLSPVMADTFQLARLCLLGEIDFMVKYASGAVDASESWDSEEEGNATAIEHGAEEEAFGEEAMDWEGICHDTREIVKVYLGASDEEKKKIEFAINVYSQDFKCEGMEWVRKEAEAVVQELIVNRDTLVENVIDDVIEMIIGEAFEQYENGETDQTIEEILATLEWLENNPQVIIDEINNYIDANLHELSVLDGITDSHCASTAQERQKLDEALEKVHAIDDGSMPAEPEATGGGRKRAETQLKRLLQMAVSRAQQRK